MEGMDGSARNYNTVFNPSKKRIGSQKKQTGDGEKRQKQPKGKKMTSSVTAAPPSECRQRFQGSGKRTGARWTRGAGQLRKGEVRGPYQGGRATGFQLLRTAANLTQEITYSTKEEIGRRRSHRRIKTDQGNGRSGGFREPEGKATCRTSYGEVGAAKASENSGG